MKILVNNLKMKRALLYITMSLACLPSMMAQPTFRTAELERLATVLRIDVSSLPEGYSHPEAEGLRLTVHKTAETIDHLGRQLFSDDVRTHGQTAVLDFLERYFLQLRYPPQTKTATMMTRDDEFHFLKGQLSTVDYLQPTDDFAYSYDQSHYQATWSREGQKLLEVYFPVEYELISGENKIEAENNLMADVQHTSIPTVLDRPRPFDNATYLNKSISNRLYRQDGQLISSQWHPVETVANMMLSLQAAQGYLINITQVSYGFKKTEFNVPLQQWIAFCQSHGCELYFGVQGISNEGEVKALVLAVNEQENYNHVLTVRVPAQIIGQQQGTVQARLYPYVPTHNVKEMFAPYLKSNPKTISQK